MNGVYGKMCFWSVNVNDDGPQHWTGICENSAFQLPRLWVFPGRVKLKVKSENS